MTDNNQVWIGRDTIRKPFNWRSYYSHYGQADGTSKGNSGWWVVVSDSGARWLHIGKSYTQIIKDLQREVDTAFKYAGEETATLHHQVIYDIYTGLDFTITAIKQTDLQKLLETTYIES